MQLQSLDHKKQQIQRALSYKRSISVFQQYIYRKIHNDDQVLKHKFYNRNNVSLFLVQLFCIYHSILFHVFEFRFLINCED